MTFRLASGSSPLPQPVLVVNSAPSPPLNISIGSCLDSNLLCVFLPACFMELSHDDSILRTATIKKPNTNFLLNDSVARLHPPGLRNILRLYSPTHFLATEIGRATFVRMPDNSSRLMANLNARISDANRTVEERSILCVGTERLELDKIWSTDCSRPRRWYNRPYRPYIHILFIR